MSRFTIRALWYGAGDFEKSILPGVNGGYDTDRGPGGRDPRLHPWHGSIWNLSFPPVDLVALPGTRRLLPADGGFVDPDGGQGRIGLHREFPVVEAHERDVARDDGSVRFSFFAEFFIEAHDQDSARTL